MKSQFFLILEYNKIVCITDEMDSVNYVDYGL